MKNPGHFWVEINIAGEGRKPGRTQIDQVALKAAIKPKRAAEIVAQVDAAVVDWARHARDSDVPGALAERIADALRSTSPGSSLS